MAYEAQNQNDQQKQQNGFGTQGTQQTNQNTQAENIPLLGGQQSNLVQGVSTQNAQQVQGGQSNTSTGQKSSGMGARLSNLKKYIEGNRNSGMAQKIQGGIENIRTGLQGNINQSKGQFQEKTAGEKARIARGETLIQGTQQGGLGLLEKGRTEQYTQEAPVQATNTQAPTVTLEAKQNAPVGESKAPITDIQSPVVQKIEPVDFSQYGKTAQDRLNEFNKYREGLSQQYQIDNEADLNRQATELQKRADLSQNEAGRYQLLRETFNRPAYTTGQQRLDQLLLQASPEESAKLAAMAKTINDPVQQQMNELQALKTAENQDIVNKALALKGNIAKGFYGDVGQPVIDSITGKITNVGTGALGQFNTELEQKRLESAKTIGTQFAQLQAKIQNGEPLTQEDLVKLNRGEDANAQDFLTNYNKGVKKTLGEQISTGGYLTDNQINYMTSLKTPDGKPILGIDAATIKSIQQDQVLTPDQFATNRGYNQYTDVNGQPFFAKQVGERQVYQPETDSYVNEPVMQSMNEEYGQYRTDYLQTKQNLQDYLKEAATSIPEISNYREKQDLDYNQYLKSLTPEDIAVGKVASKEDYIRQAALAQLANQDFGPLVQGNIEQANTISQVGAGKFDLEQALNMAREYYNPNTKSSIARVGVAAASPSSNLTIGEKTSNELGRTGSNLLGDNRLGETGDVALKTSASDFTGTADSSQKAIEDLLKGKVGSAAGNTVNAAGEGFLAMSGVAPAVAQVAAAEKFLTGGENISRAYESVKDSAKQIVNDVFGSFWCTEVFKHRLVTVSELKDVYKFLKAIIFTHARFLSWYIDNGPRIAKKANELGFDWYAGKNLLFYKLIPLFKSGDIKGAVDCYDKFTVHICEFIGEKPPYECRKNGIIDSLRFLPKVLKFYWSKK